MFLSVLLGNCEVWPLVTKNDIKRLESCDNQFLSQIMGVSSKGSYILMMLEGALIPIRYIIITRRLNYLHSILKSENSSMNKQVMIKQVENPSRQDWISQVYSNLNEFQINLSLDEIEKLSKYKFKKIVRNACLKTTFNYLLSEKEKLSKGKQIKYNSFKIQNYMKPGTGLSTQDIKLIYSIRTRNLYLKTNFPGMFDNDKCVNSSCQEKDNEFHLFYSKCFSEENTLVRSGIEYENIFSNNVRQQKVVKDILMTRYEKRLKILSSHGRSK